MTAPYITLHYITLHYLDDDGEAPEDGAEPDDEQHPAALRNPARHLGAAEVWGAHGRAVQWLVWTFIAVGLSAGCAPRWAAPR